MPHQHPHTHFLSRTPGLGIVLRHGDIDAQLVDSRQVEQFAIADVVACADQAAHVDIALDDNPAKGRGHPSKRLDLFQPRDVGLRRRQIGPGLLMRGASLFQFLLRHRVHLAQAFPARQRGLCQSQACTDLLSRRMRLQ